MPKRSSEEDIKEEGNLNFNFGSEKKDMDEKEESVINGANDEGLDSVKIYFIVHYFSRAILNWFN